MKMVCTADTEMNRDYIWSHEASVWSAETNLEHDEVRWLGRKKAGRWSMRRHQYVHHWVLK